MKAYIRNKKILVDGLIQDKNGIREQKLECIISNDNIGKTLTINNADVGFTIPFEKIERYLK